MRIQALFLVIALGCLGWARVRNVVAPAANAAAVGDGEKPSGGRPWAFENGGAGAGTAAVSADGAKVAAPAPLAAPPAVRLTAYLPDYELARADAAAVAKLDDLIYFSIEPQTNGALDTARAPATALKRLHELRGKSPLRLWIAVGGGNRSQGFADMATDAASRSRFVAALEQYCVDNGFAGADFDWEFPFGKAEQDAYNTLLQDVKRQFASHHLEVSVAVVASQQFSREAVAAVDQFRLMSYDHDGPEHSSLVAAKADVDVLLARGIPRQKISLGVPFYGRTPQAKALSWRQVRARYHPASGVDTADGYSFNGPTTIERKVQFARDEKLGGLMIWELGQDLATDDPNSLLSAAWKSLHNAPIP